MREPLTQATRLLWQCLDYLVSLANRREHPEHSAQHRAMSFLRKRRAAIIRNHDIVSAVDAVARSPFDDSVRRDSREHQMGDTLGRENRLEWARKKRTDPGLADHDIAGM